jgi:hypothetical protein
MEKMTNNPSKMHVVKVLVSTMALLIGELVGRKSMGLERVASVVTTELLVGSKDATTYVEASTASWSQSISFMTVVRMMWTITSKKSGNVVTLTFIDYRHHPESTCSRIGIAPADQFCV